ncbi:hypothetical protein VTJ04DRAFT_6920 [Mycothermus thermophilus]|uniref:uncharacterized protein n=1 Tax=Humicola insolens TaxID=85995 RepID=UPI003743923A
MINHPRRTTSIVINLDESNHLLHAGSSCHERPTTHHDDVDTPWRSTGSSSRIWSLETALARVCVWGLMHPVCHNGFEIEEFETSKGEDIHGQRSHLVSDENHSKFHS